VNRELLGRDQQVGGGRKVAWGELNIMEIHYMYMYNNSIMNPITNCLREGGEERGLRIMPTG
jgi:hypothetical protein